MEEKGSDIKLDENGADLVQVEISYERPKKKRDLLYSVDEYPPWYLWVLLGFQQFLTALGGTFTYPLITAPFFCIVGDTVGLSELIGTVIFVAGLSTLLQSTFGVRLPIVQSCSLTFITPVMVLLSTPKWECPYTDTTGKVNKTLLPEYGSDEHREIWHSHMREVQGAILLASLFQVVVGFSGLMGLLMKVIGPLTIAPTISLIGLSLFGAAAEKAATQWWIALVMVVLIAIFSQYLRKINVPCAMYKRNEGCSSTRLPIFSLFPVLIAIVVAWIICVILTVTDALPNKPGKWGYEARTDVRSDVLSKAQWFRFPYPGQWGMPTVSVAGVFGMLAGIIASMIESVGDYYACARLAGAPPPSGSAISRGIGMEGITCMIAGAWGSGGGTTSYSENIGAIGITKVGSRIVIQCGGIIMIVLGCLGKFSALFVTIPDPLVGGMFFAMFGMVTAVGLSNLHYVDLNSTRNLFVLGVSMFFGLSFPSWMNAHKDAIQTNSDIADQIISVLLSTSMFVGGVVALILDNTIPGTDEERGIIKWRQKDLDYDEESQGSMSVYDMPFIQKYINKITCTKYLPFCPNFIGDHSKFNLRRWFRNRKKNRHMKNGGDDNKEFSNTEIENTTL